MNGSPEKKMSEDAPGVNPFIGIVKEKRAHNFIDLTKRKFGRLKATSIADKTKQGRLIWNCICDCGNKITVPGNNLTSGNTTSCGCLKIEILLKRSTKHGMAETPTYNIWKDLRKRCNNSHSKNFKYYGDRGITVCSRWSEFKNFYEDMGDKPEGMTIERTNNNKGYSPENCIWANRKIQARNTRNNKKIIYNGKEKCLAEWAEILKINYSTLYWRLQRYAPQIAFNM